MKTVAALFVLEKSHYKSMAGVDSYDIRRNALTYRGLDPIIAHPPCRSWGSLKTVCTKAGPGEHELGPWAIEQARRRGGIVEHPLKSTLFAHCGCPDPNEALDPFGGFTVDVDQYDWGHRARKWTRLYIVGLPLYWATPLRAGDPTHCITQGHGIRRGHPKFKSRVSDWERMATPPAFAEWLVEMARQTHPSSSSYSSSLNKLLKGIEEKRREKEDGTQVPSRDVRLTFKCRIEVKQ